MSLKYVKANYLGDIVIFSFPKLINHSNFTKSMGIKEDDILSAGFIRMATNSEKLPTLKCFGKSVSLKKQSDPNDSELATRQHYSEMDFQDFQHLWNG